MCTVGAHVCVTIFAWVCACLFAYLCSSQCQEGAAFGSDRESSLAGGLLQQLDKNSNRK